MINSETSRNIASNDGSEIHSFDKQPPIGMKKTVLKDVQNQNDGLIRNNHESVLFAAGRSMMDVTKVSAGSKRLTPECPSSSPNHPSLKSNVNEHIVNARRRFELELGRGRIQNNMDRYIEHPQSKNLCQSQQQIIHKQTQPRENNSHCLAGAGSNNFTQMVNFSYCGKSIPSSLRKYDNRTQAAQSDSLKHTSVLCKSTDSKGTNDQHRTERFVRLQSFLKQCDESNLKDYIQMLLHLSPAELSRHAVDLEKRAIQLTVEEAKEMQRVKAFNVVGKSALTNYPFPTTQLLQPKNENY